MAPNLEGYKQYLDEFNQLYITSNRLFKTYEVSRHAPVVPHVWPRWSWTRVLGMSVHMAWP